MANINKKVSLTFLVAATISLGFMSTDIYAPSMPDMGAYFGVDENIIQITVASCLLGASLSGLIGGALSDFLGRRPLMVWGIALFTLASLISAVCSSISLLIISRFIQGCGIGIFNVVGLATLQETYSPKESAKAMAQMEMIFTILPTITPVLGGYVHIMLGWRANFLIILVVALLVLAGVFVFFKDKKSTLSLPQLKLFSFFENYSSLTKNKTFMGYVLLSPIIYGAEICLMTILPFYCIQYWQISPDIYGFWVGATFAAYGFGSLVTSRIIDSLGLKRTMLLGLSIIFVSSLCQMAMSLSSDPLPIILIVFLSCHQFGMAVLYAPSIAKALSAVPKTKGSASAIPNMLFMVAATLGATFAGLSEQKTLTFGAFTMVSLSFISLSLFLIISLKGKLSSIGSVLGARG